MSYPRPMLLWDRFYRLLLLKRAAKARKLAKFMEAVQLPLL